MAFSDAGLRDRIRLDSVTCVLDGDQVFAHPEYPPLMELKLQQSWVFGHVDSEQGGPCRSEQVKKVMIWLDAHFNRLCIVETDYCEVPYEIMLGVGRFDAARAVFNSHAVAYSCTDLTCYDQEHDHDHSKVFSTCSYETNEPLALEALRETMRKLPGTIYRAKGVIYTSDAPQRRAVLQVVGTDGVLEACNSEGELYGFQRVTELLTTCPVAESIADAARAFGQEDDISVLTITRLPVNNVSSYERAFARSIA
jgi:G3E family GTPase